MPGSPIEHVVIIVKENHGFDWYFGKYPGADGDATLAPAASPPDVDPHHDHTTWVNRATKAVREQYGEADIPSYWAYASQFTLCDRYFTDVAGRSTPNHLMLITDWYQMAVASRLGIHGQVEGLGAPGG
jgi:phospholipase C